MGVIEMGTRDVIDQVTQAIERSNEVLKAAKLSTKQRKKLKDSQFCGPGRSFPVNDCAHYTAALRLLNRSKYSDDTKSKIRACISRKGKSLGCTSKKEKSTDIEILINSEAFKVTRYMVEESIKNPGMDLEFPENCC